MPDAVDTPSDVILTPHGLLLVEKVPPPSPWPEVETGWLIGWLDAVVPLRACQPSRRRGRSAGV